VFFLVGAALAQEPPPDKPPWRDRTYVFPHLNVRALGVNDAVVLQGVGGLEGGFVRRWNKAPHYVSQTRAVALGLYGLTTGSAGGDFRVGSFVGPDLSVVRLAFGPDVWFNGYGNAGALDYWLPWSPGVDLPASAYWKIAPSVLLDTAVVPGWAFDPDRQSGGVGPFHELTLLAAVHVELRGPSIVLGWQRTYNGVGVIDGLILSLSLR
jgi:hypothetical protein